MISVPISWKLCTKLIIIYIPRKLIDCRPKWWPFRENTGVRIFLLRFEDRTWEQIETQSRLQLPTFFFSHPYYLIIRQLARVFIFNYAANRESISSDLSPFPLTDDEFPIRIVANVSIPKISGYPLWAHHSSFRYALMWYCVWGVLSFTKERVFVPRRIGDSPIKLKTAKLIALRLYYSSDPPSVLTSVFHQCHDLNDIRRNQDGKKKKRET